MRTLIIAEAGVNHNGSIDIAKKLVDAAAEAGVDFVKFQTFKAENLVSKIAPKAEYQKKNSEFDGNQYEMLKKLELSLDDHHILIDYCKLKNVAFFSTGFDLESLDLLYELGLRLFKIPSGEITNLPYLRKVAKLAEKVIISTGMCTMDDIEKAILVFLNKGFSKDDIVVLHCNTEYPTPMVDVNLNSMKSISNKFNVSIGYSDHTLGIEVPIAAVALGAVVIEKHFTLDRLMNGPDHAASLEPIELIKMVSSIRNIEKALGNSEKKPSNSEIKNISIARKSIHLAKDLKLDHIIVESDLQMLRPGDGISPMEMDNIIGKKIAFDLPAGTKLEYKYLKND
ncbi:N-acetylneuraminate synthase [Sediminibacterium sp.]|uniref:N-acetylneuraminate synthase n=1 Tax=Sediminibacterium sp. TaxID=1917865 RepID=UPI0025D206A0|nr:N-acetylneuraminate synthase [Sediminibacterium sp.]